MKTFFKTGPALLPVLLLALMACRKETPVAEPEEAVPICFEGLVTKAGDTFTQGDRIRVWAEDAHGNAIMSGQIVTLTASGWQYAPTKYWPQTGAVTFYAVSPADEAIIAPEADGDPYCFDVVCPEDAATDILCSGLTVLNDRQPVRLVFTHIMARIAVQARIRQFPTDGSGVRITAVSLTGHEGSGSWRMDTGGWPGFWSRKTFRQELSCPVTTSGARPCTDLYVVPTVTGSSVKLVLEWETYNKTTGETVRTKTGTADFSGKTLDYNQTTEVVFALNAAG